MSTKLFKCRCKHEYQDKKYGKGIRLHNKTTYPNTNKGTLGEYRCTVCKSYK